MAVSDDVKVLWFGAAMSIGTKPTSKIVAILVAFGGISDMADSLGMPALDP